MNTLAIEPADDEASVGATVDGAAPRLPRQPLRFCLRYMRMYALLVGLIFALEIGQAVCSVMMPYAIGEIMDAVAEASDRSELTWEALTPVLRLLFGLSLGVVLFSRASGALLVILGPALRRAVRRDLFAYLQQHSQRYFLSSFAGSLSNRISEVSMSVAHTLWTAAFDFWPLLISFGVSLVLLTNVHADLGLLLGSWLTAYIAISFWLAAKCRPLARDYAAARSLVSGKIVDSVTNVMNAKLFARRDFERSYLDEYLDLEVGKARRTFWFMEAIRWFQYVASMLLVVGVVSLALAIWRSGDMSTGEFAMASSLALLLIEQARGLSRRFLEFFEYIGNINDGVNIIVIPHEVIDRPGAVRLDATEGRVEVDAIDFAYSAGKPVFEKLSLEIPAGQKVGLVGYSGSGKSTLLNLVLRLFEPQGGCIRIDGQDIANVTQESLREAVSMIPQDPMLFHRSLRENIRYGRLAASDEEVEQAARLAHADEFIRATDTGYDSLVGERGIKLSGGQRQRIALARAFLKDAPLLLLDEATSSLDSVTERHVQDALTELMHERTVIVVAHRLSTLSHLDRIIVFDQGRIVEDGTHDALLARAGHYAHMWSMQAGGFLPDTQLEPAAERKVG